MKKIALTLVLALALVLGMSALSVGAIVHPDFIYYNDGSCFSTPKKPSAHQAHGWLPVTVVGNNADENGKGNGNVAFDADGKLLFNQNTNWGTKATEQTTVNPGWWAAAAATYAEPVTVNEFIVPVIGGVDGWGQPYAGDVTQHKLWVADDVRGSWTEVTGFKAEAIEHNGDYVDSSWGYVAILRYTFEQAITGQFFLLTTGTDQCLLQMNHFYAAFNPKNVVETTEAATTEAATTEADATEAGGTEADITDDATADAPVTEDNGDSGLPTAAIIGIAVGAAVIVAVIVVVVVKKKK